MPFVTADGRTREVEQPGVREHRGVVEPTGSETQVTVRHGRQELVCLFRDRVVSRPGETMCIIPLAQHIPIFDTETAQRLAA